MPLTSDCSCEVHHKAKRIERLGFFEKYFLSLCLYYGSVPILDRMFTKWCRLTLLLTSLLGVSGLAAAPQAQSTSEVTAQDWKRLRSKAKTAEEFRTCAKWCRSQAGRNQKTAAQYEAEVRAVDARPANRQGAKYPPTRESLRAKVDYYQGQVKHWNDLAASYDKKAAVAESPTRK